MLQEIKSQFPAWCSDNTTPFSLTLSDDLDSLLSCYLLEQIKGYPIHYFYDFKNLSKIENANRQSIGIDIDLVNGKCWGNHLTFQSLGDIFNIECANLNTVCKITKN
ncbi:MAG: hypothetical protein PHY55_04215, partial [Bacteroidales bacterium]|nr:hypothetical protein [Bacteroidales bacterium]